MDNTHLALLFLAIGLIAFLYSSVGHAGASGYIATMTLFGLAPMIIRPTALVLNILVAAIGTFQFWRAGYFSWKLFWPFALLSVPAAYLGGYFTAKRSIPSLGLVLAAAAIIGGTFGSRLGSRRFPSRTISILLAIVLMIAGTKLIFTK
jgi:uncharacterized membrane protein YfcA